MKSISARVDNETATEIERLADERGSSVSQITRDLIRKGLEFDDVANERDRLQRRLSATNARQEDITELVEYVEEQREAERYRDQRRRRLDEANILRRWKWKLTGIPTENQS